MKFEMIAYNLGFFPIMVMLATIMGHYQFVMADVLKMEPSQLGILWMIYSLIGGITQPLCGILLQHIGERYALKLVLIPTIISYYYIWCPPLYTMNDNNLLYWHEMLMLIIFGVCESVMQIAYFALFPLYFNEEERVQAASLKQFFSILGLLSGMAIPPLLAGANWKDLSYVTQLIVICSIISFSIALLGTQSLAASVYKLKEDKNKNNQNTKIKNQNFWDKFGLTSSPFRGLLYSQFLIQLGNNMLAASFPLHLKYIMHITIPVNILNNIELSVGAQTSIILTSFYIVGLLSAPIWAKVTSKYGPLTAYRLDCLVYSALLCYYLIPQIDGFHLSLVGSSLLGFALSGFLSLPDMLLSTIIDIDAQQNNNGIKRPGTFFGVRGIVLKIASAVQGQISGHILATTNFNPKELIQNQQALSGIQFATVVCPVVAFSVGAILLGFVQIKSSNIKQE